MEGIGITHKGMEEIAKEETRKILGKEAHCFPAGIEFTADTPLSLAEIAYKAQTLRRVLLKLSACKVDEVEAMAEILGTADISPYCTKEQTFAVRCERVGEHEFSSQDLMMEIGKRIEEKSGRKVNLKEPEIVLFVSVQDDHCVMGIDIAGFDLSKRHWRIFSQSALKPTIAAAMLRYGGYENGKILLDPFCRDGAFGIEAFCYATGRSPHFHNKREFQFQKHVSLKAIDWNKQFEAWDQQRALQGSITCTAPQFGEVKGTEKNAKIAGVEKNINFRRVESEWLDFKFEKNSVDCAVSLFPQPGAKHPEKQLRKTYQQILTNLVTVLKNNGKICTLSNPLLEATAREVGLKVMEMHEVWQGKLKLRVGVWGA